MKQLLLTIAFLFYSTFALSIDLIVPASSGGTYHKFATIIKKDLESKGIEAVSYTHLTLPTICSV